MASKRTPRAASQTSPAQLVVHYVREGIRNGELVPGQRLVEPELMSRWSVSRGAVREALTQLRVEGLIDIQRYRGAHVRILPRRMVIELNQIRAAVEGLGARLAAMNLDKDGRRRVKAMFAPFDAVAIDYDGYNRRFHAAIVELSGNQSLDAVIASTQIDTFRLQFQRLLTRPEVARRSHAEHRAILEAILARDGDEAERLMIAHIRASSDEILSAPDHYFS